ncbi:LuxR C-terminal-related transcriptional regulator [Streptomyces sp. NPDC026672]|uniref:LuxR C-terminal-related transcriptional regulator n=1 Tax=unclassified Streptomyces TaxID=2593676 RepID=UPI0033F35A93
MLEALGVSAFDETVYRELLADGERKVGTLAGLVDASAARVTHALRRLAALGLAQRVGPGRWEATRPRTALTTLLNQRRVAAASAFSEVESAVELLNGVYQRGRLHTDPGSLVEVLTGRENVARLVVELSRSVTSHLWILDRPPYLGRPNGRPHDDTTETAVTSSWLDRGVDIRSIYCPESMAYPGRFETILKLNALGEQSRMLPHLPFKLHILDRSVALVPLAGTEYDSVAVVHASGLLDALMELFEAYWNKAEPLAGDRGRSPSEPGGDEPGEADLILLRMLHSGLKDQAIARQLGMSTRTATRRIADLMHRLGARTRFQAGARARERGWLT